MFSQNKNIIAALDIITDKLILNKISSWQLKISVLSILEFK